MALRNVTLEIPTLIAAQDVSIPFTKEHTFLAIDPSRPGRLLRLLEQTNGWRWTTLAVREGSKPIENQKLTHETPDAALTAALKAGTAVLCFSTDKEMFELIMEQKLLD